MKRVSVTEAKDQLGVLLDQVMAGEEVIVEETGQPIARITAIDRACLGSEGRRERLIAEGVLVPRRTDLLDEILDQPPVKIASGVSIVESILEERSR